jgi:hypothetical protein
VFNGLAKIMFMRESKKLNLGSVIKSFLLLMWQTLAIRSINAIFTHPNLSSKPKNVL